ncbi:MAG: DNA repair protein RecO [Bacteroidota bacterium]|nr:DNA repair protein RecO [Bacteroidota bacterium]
MLKTKAIVLHHIKYSDNSYIVNMYTQQIGRQAFMVKGVGAKKSKIKANILQPLTLLEIEFEHKSNKNFQYLKNISILNPASTIIFDISKLSIAFFWAEIINKSILEEEKNTNLFDYVFSSIKMLDIKTQGLANYNIYFIIHLTKYLGFFPNNNYNDISKYFDIKTGDYKQIRPMHTFTIDKKESILLSNFLQYSDNQCENLKISKEYKNNLLKTIIDYYSIHVVNFKNIKSLEVLQEVFQ